MPTLHALIVGINNYPDPKHTLSGCLNDVQHMDQFLKTYCSAMGFTYRPLMLTDKAATRKAVINGFDHFKAANAEDCCLFHYAGHGARSDAPPEFWDLEQDKILESIVCWDSRLKGGHDLMDKELSYLIWRASQRTERPFVTIMDCCHSGTMRNTVTEEGLGMRQLRDIGSALPPAEFTGIADYKKETNGQLSPPIGRRVHLAAARDIEYAQEVKAGGKPRGVFTYCLIEALENNGPLVAYADLLNRVNLRIRNAVSDQSAQLDATNTEDRNLGFLFTDIDARSPSYLVAWDKASKSWMLNAGAVHGIPSGDKDSPTILELQADSRRLTVESVKPTRSTVSGMDDSYDKKRAYVALIRRRAIPKLTLAFAAGSDPAGVGLLQKAIQSQTTGMVQLKDSVTGNGYLIHARDGAFFLSRTNNPAPLFQRETGYTEESAAAFLRKLDKVANWQQVLGLQNPDTSIQPAEIELELYRVLKPGNIVNDAPVELVDWQASPVVFRYGEPNLAPGFKLKLRNSGPRPLWVGMVYLSSDFSITNNLLPKVMLNPGEEYWIRQVYQGNTYQTLPLSIDAAQLKQGVKSVDEYMQILISTEELNTDFYNQKPLAVDTALRMAKRGAGFGGSEEVQEPDWTAKTVWVRIEKGDMLKKAPPSMDHGVFIP